MARGAVRYAANPAAASPEILCVVCIPQRTYEPPAPDAREPPAQRTSRNLSAAEQLSGCARASGHPRSTPAVESKCYRDLELDGRSRSPKFSGDPDRATGDLRQAATASASERSLPLLELVGPSGPPAGREAPRSTRPPQLRRCRASRRSRALPTALFARAPSLPGPLPLHATCRRPTTDREADGGAQTNPPWHLCWAMFGEGPEPFHADRPQIED